MDTCLQLIMRLKCYNAK